MHVDSSSIENQFYRATFDLWTGAMTGLEMKSTDGNWQVFARRTGECRGLRAGRRRLLGALWKPEWRSAYRHDSHASLPEPDRSKFSNEWVGGNGKTSAGPVFSEFHIDHPFGDNKFSTRVRVYNGIQRIDFETSITNNDKSVRYRVLFPTSIRSGRRFDEIPFGAIERPQRQEFPAQNWFDYSDGKHGVALLNVGLPGSSVTDNTMLLSLMRSARINSYGFIGGYEPGTSSDLGLELGQTAHLSICAGASCGRLAAGQSVSSRAWNLTIRWWCVRSISILERSRKSGDTLMFQMPNVSAERADAREDGGLIVRVYEAAGKPADAVKFHFTAPVTSVSEVNLMEDRLGSAALDNNSVRFSLRPFEIKTFDVQLAPTKGTASAAP